MWGLGRVYLRGTHTPERTPPPYQTPSTHRPLHAQPPRPKHIHTHLHTSRPKHNPPPLTPPPKKTQALFLAVEAHPWQIVVLLRLVPVPIGAKNYGMVRGDGCAISGWMDGGREGGRKGGR